MKPAELSYATTHEWIELSEANGDKIATVGISEFAVRQLTDLVYIELPEVGHEVKAGESFGEIESVKAVSDLYSPVSGTIVEVNQDLSDALEQLNEDPYDKGWIVKVKVRDGTGLSDLMDYSAYQKQCEEEA